VEVNTVANAQAYYDTATITADNVFKVEQAWVRLINDV
jgi:hypothetical protein